MFSFFSQKHNVYICRAVVAERRNVSNNHLVPSEIKCSNPEADRCCCPSPVYILERRSTRESGLEDLCRNAHTSRSGSDNRWRSSVLCRDRDENCCCNSGFLIYLSFSLYLYHSGVHGNLVHICRRRCHAAECRLLRSCRGTTGSDLPLRTGGRKRLE